MMRCEMVDEMVDGYCLPHFIILYLSSSHQPPSHLLGWNDEIYVTRKIERKFIQTISRHLVRDDEKVVVDDEMMDGRS